MYYTEDGIHLIETPQDSLKHLMGVSNLLVSNPGRLGTIDQINRSTYSFWRDQQVEPDLQGILQKHYDRLAGGGTSHSFNPFEELPSPYVASPKVNVGRMVAEAWETYVGSKPMDSIFSRKFIMDALGEDDEPEPVEQPTLGLMESYRG